MGNCRCILATDAALLVQTHPKHHPLRRRQGDIARVSAWWPVQLRISPRAGSCVSHIPILHRCHHQRPKCGPMSEMNQVLLCRVALSLSLWRILAGGEAESNRANFCPCVPNSKPTLFLSVAVTRENKGYEQLVKGDNRMCARRDRM